MYTETKETSTPAGESTQVTSKSIGHTVGCKWYVTASLRTDRRSHLGKGWQVKGQQRKD